MDVLSSQVGFLHYEDPEHAPAIYCVSTGPDPSARSAEVRCVSGCVGRATNTLLHPTHRDVVVLAWSLAPCQVNQAIDALLSHQTP